jgi:hypothetical protein
MDPREAMMKSDSKSQSKRGSMTITQRDSKPVTLEDIVAIFEEKGFSENQKKTKAMNKLRDYLTKKYPFE